MHVAVLGGYGTVGRALVMDLLKSPDISLVTVAGRRQEKGRKLLEEYGEDKLAFSPIDLETDDVSELLHKADLVVNAASPRFNLMIMNRAVKERTHYLDLAGMFTVAARQLELHPKFVEAGLTAVLCMGCCPGLSNVLAKKLADSLDRTEEVHIRVGSRRGPDFKGFNLSPKIQLEEFTRKPIVYENGRFKELEPLAGRGTHVFGDPIGEAEGFYAIHSEVLFLSRSIEGVERVTYWVAFPEETLRKMDALIEWGLTSTEPLRVKGISLSPREFLDAFLERIEPVSGYVEEHKALQVEARGTRNGLGTTLCLETVVGSNRELDLTSSAYWAGVPASVVCQMIARGEIDRPGVFAPESIVEAGRLLEELRIKGIEVKDISSKQSTGS
ncbi:MAG: saccharopine dehydrogenase NADP-binding domain-containing protein [Deltaproteobacteria bacterium]|nr:saccharopine dehydrogenase NADP-binding domain-containing protein [Deltaproteobacteria bacterium]MBW2121139.1 saccharopine dehydrogenase NADP-binding domain-containing protein [Deltaproteobacteria bacterium]